MARITNPGYKGACIAICDGSSVSGLTSQFIVTTCTARRRTLLANKYAAAILMEEWRTAHERHGWAIGRYVVLPDHVHFFCAAELDAKPMPKFMQLWKQWTSKRLVRELKVTGAIWQEEFFDHVLRSSESYGQKWDYVRENPFVPVLAPKSKTGRGKARSKI